MTVPANTASKGPEALSRPQRPQRPQRPDVALSQQPVPRGGLGGLADFDQSQTYTTAGGRRFHVDVPAVPVARKKTGALQASVIVTFCLLIVAAVGLAIWVVQVMTANREIPLPDPVAAGDAHRQVLGYDPDVNPFEVDHLSFLGVPLKQKVVLVIDASVARDSWFRNVKEAVMFLARKDKTNLSLRLVFATEQGPKWFAGSDNPSERYLAALNRFLNQTVAEGYSDVGLAVEKAMAGMPEQLILVTEQRLFDDQIRQLGRLLEGLLNTRFDAVLMHIRLPQLAVLTTRYNGVCITLTSRQLNDWIAEAGLEREFRTGPIDSQAARSMAK